MAKHVKMMVLDRCPHCRRAFELMDDLQKKHPEYSAVEVEVIEESREPQKTEGYDYWYVPTFFVEDVKIHEGVPSREAVEAVFLKALS
ncbi:thioredoxin family protein [Christensenellaceae bacterium OttesenSCG-928-K19]|nr:thioredoxin family protein [Christensenellaceae bacterium OttesenSCG-928-K19]